MAMATLLKLTDVPNCPKIFLPTASASMRMYCAQNAADKGTIDNLLEAIALVEVLPLDHPLRPQINAAVEEWSREILRLADESFQAGDLEGAIATVRKIPRQVEAYNLIEERISYWNSVWAEGEGIVKEVEAHLWESEWNLAFRTAVKLLNIDNKYWANNRFQQLTDIIRIAQDESRQLDSAYAALSEGGVDNFLKVIQQATEITSKSYVYKQAQDLIKQAEDKLLSTAQNRLDNSDWAGVLDITRRVPARLSIQSKMEDMAYLARAGTNSEVGTIASLRNAVQEAGKVSADSSLYSKSKNLIARWQLEIGDIAHLNKARKYAQAGGTGNLSSAISEARLIAAQNPRSSEAQQEIKKWLREIQVLQDRPIIDRAVQFARSGTVASLQEGIEEASRVAPNRALSAEAQQKIKQWRGQIQTKQDQPILDRANQLAQTNSLRGLQSAIQEASRISPNRALSGQAQTRIADWRQQLQTREDQPILNQADTLARNRDYPRAISTARQINQGRALYRQAQGKIQIWQKEVQAQQNLQEASQLASNQSSESLTRAISIAQNIPSGTDVGRQARESANRWSWELLSLAESQANQNLSEAVRIAKQISSNTEAYDNARSRIRTWEQLLTPEPPPTPIQPDPAPPAELTDIF